MGLKRGRIYSPSFFWCVISVSFNMFKVSFVSFHCHYVMKYLCLITLLFPFCAPAQKKSNNNFNTFLPNDPAIEYTGRIDFQNPFKPSFCYSGVSIKTVLVGSDISMSMEDLGVEDEQHTNYYNVMVDDSLYSVLKAQKGKHNYQLVQGLKAGKHTIEIYKRTECFVGSSRFLGFSVPEGNTIEKPTTKTRRIEFIGNSITCGYGNEVMVPAPPQGNPSTGFHSKNENNYLTYGSITARNLNAYYQSVAYSGRGLYRNNNGSTESTMPVVYKMIFPDELSSPLWDVSTHQPDVLVVNLGTNDFYLEMEGNFVDEERFVKTYIAFLEELRSLYPQAKIVCAVGNMMSDYWPVDRKCWTRIQQLTTTVVTARNAKGDEALYYFKFDPQSPPYGEDWHPSTLTHQKMADMLTPFIREITGW